MEVLYLVRGTAFSLTSLTESRRQVTPRCNDSSSPNALHMAFHDTLLPTIDVPIHPSTLQERPRRSPSQHYIHSMDHRRHNRSVYGCALQHNNPRLHPKRQQTLRILRLPVHNPHYTNPLSGRPNLHSQRNPRLPNPRGFSSTTVPNQARRSTKMDMDQEDHTSKQEPKGIVLHHVDPSHCIVSDLSSFG